MWWKLTLTIKRFVELDPVFVDKVAVVFSMPEAGIAKEPHNICLCVLSSCCSYRKKKNPDKAQGAQSWSIQQQTHPSEQHNITDMKARNRLLKTRLRQTGFQEKKDGIGEIKCLNMTF